MPKVTPITPMETPRSSSRIGNYRRRLSDYLSYQNGRFCRWIRIFFKMENDCGVSPAPHRGFSQKARELLIGTDSRDLINVGHRGMPNKSSSEFDLRKKLNSLSSRKKDSNGSSPKSQSSVNSIPEHPTFDTIGERPAVKRHMKLSDIGKAHSCAELKSDKRLLRTFAEDNIIKMPSMDSDIGSPKMTEVDDLCLSFEGIGKSMIYSQTDNNDNNSNDVKEAKKKNKK